MMMMKSITLYVVLCINLLLITTTTTTIFLTQYVVCLLKYRTSSSFSGISRHIQAKKIFLNKAALYLAIYL